MLDHYMIMPRHIAGSILTATHVRRAVRSGRISAPTEARLSIINATKTDGQYALVSGCIAEEGSGSSEDCRFRYAWLTRYLRGCLTISCLCECRGVCRRILKDTCSVRSLSCSATAVWIMPSCTGTSWIHMKDACLCAPLQSVQFDVPQGCKHSCYSQKSKCVNVCECVKHNME